MRNKPFLLFLAFIHILAFEAQASHFFANSPTALKKLQEQVKPGDTVFLANQIWMDAQIELNFKGTRENFIYILPETPGSVVFSGASSCRIGGSFTVVAGLVFKNIPQKGPVIQFRINSRQLATNCRVTNTLIDNCNPPDRLQESNWIVFYGRNNRFDHNTILNKKNLGTTLIVELSDTLNQNNYHHIDHNYFGPRQRAGSNGGETIRIGISTFSRTSSRTVVEENFFDKCNGEVEIISVKSCDNLISRNTFYECEGGLVLRHGNRNTVTENFFIGNNRENTGGVRVINAGHSISNNFFYKLGGDRFRSAFTIMNGVPNSPINRYDPVKDVTIEGNTFIDCYNIEFCGGKDFERTAKPENVQFNNNLVYNSKGKTLFSVNDDISGIKFRNNRANAKIQALPPMAFTTEKITYDHTGDNWTINGKHFACFATPANTGAALYKETSVLQSPEKRNKIEVLPGENTLDAKVLLASDGDTLHLLPGIYKLSKTIAISKSLIITGSNKEGKKPLLQFSGEQGGISFRTCGAWDRSWSRF